MHKGIPKVRHACLLKILSAALFFEKFEGFVFLRRRYILVGKLNGLDIALLKKPEEIAFGEGHPER
ncbi:hypothetical protein CDQ83_07570 [Clostridium thermosuccinogenes]|nr:hypothetical protein CDQ83_07570 [Pseudoclostridium thermosuccinogenes]